VAKGLHTLKSFPQDHDVWGSIGIEPFLVTKISPLFGSSIPASVNIGLRDLAMATKDGLSDKLLSFANESLILVLADKPKQPGVRNDRAVAVASILLTTATATGIAILSTVNPVTLFAGTPQLRLADKSAPQPGTDQSTPIIQSVVIPSTADAETLRPTAKDVPTCEIRAPEPASRTQETDETSPEALFRKFQAWNAEQDARDLAKPIQIHPAPVAKNASASVRPTQKQQKAQTARNAKQAESPSFLSKLLPL
jgi:hypothetical protein